MTLPILVTGGTGTLGSHVVPLLRSAGRRVRILSRRGHEAADGIEYVTGDLLADQGIESAVDGVDTVVHLAGGTKGDATATQHLVRAASQAGVKHLVYISVIGADTMPIGWFKSQLQAEQAVTDSGIPYTMLRAAQFHDLVLTMAQKMAKLPLIPAPGGLRFQPVDSREVAARLVELALGEPSGRVPDLAGPRVYTLTELMRGFLQAYGKRRPLLPIRMPGKAGKAYRAGDNLALDGAHTGRITWEEFLAARAGLTTRSSRVQPHA